MENQEANGSGMYNEDWLDITIPFATEFELPIVASPLTSSWLDYNNSFSLENQLPTSPVHVPEFDPKEPFTIEIPLVTTTPTFASNVSLPMINQLGSFSMANHQVHDPNSTSNPWFGFNSFNGSANSSWFDSCGSQPMRDQHQPNIHSSANTFWSGTGGSIPLRGKHPIVNNASNTPWLASKGFFPSINQPIHVPTPRFGFNGSLPMSNQQAHVQSSGNLPLFGSKASPSMNNQVLNTQQRFSSNIITGASLPNSKFSLPPKHQKVFVPPSASNASWLDAYPSVPKQPPPPPHSSVTTNPGSGWSYYDDLHMCNVCRKMFPSTHALGGHMSSHAKARKKEAMMAGQPFKSEYFFSSSQTPLNTTVSHGVDGTTKEEASPPEIPKQKFSPVSDICKEHNVVKLDGPAKVLAQSEKQGYNSDESVSSEWRKGK